VDLNRKEEGGNCCNAVGLLGDVLSGRVPFRGHDAGGSSDTGGARSLDCTLFKSVGTAIQDVVTASEVVKRAKELGLGTEVDM